MSREVHEVHYGPSPANSRAGNRNDTHGKAGKVSSFSRPVISLNPVRVTIFLAITIVFLTAASLAGQIARHFLDMPTLFGLVDFFYLDAEANLPTLFQVLHLLLAAMLLSLLGVQEQSAGHPQARYWFILAAGFVLMAIDEGAMLHDRLPLHRFVDNPEEWTSLWVFPGFLIVLAAAYYFRHFVTRMPLKDGLQIVAAGALFIGGAIGVETIIAAVFDTADPDWKLSFDYILMVHGEELLEMCGILIFNRFLLYRLAGHPPLTVSVRRQLARRAARHPAAAPMPAPGVLAGRDSVKVPRSPV